MNLLDRFLGAVGLIRKKKAEQERQDALDIILRNNGWQPPGIETVSFIRECRKYGFRLVYFLENKDSSRESARKYAERLAAETAPSFDKELFARNLVENSKYMPDLGLGK